MTDQHSTVTTGLVPPRLSFQTLLAFRPLKVVSNGSAGEKVPSYGGTAEEKSAPPSLNRREVHPLPITDPLSVLELRARTKALEPSMSSLSATWNSPGGGTTVEKSGVANKDIVISTCVTLQVGGKPWTAILVGTMISMAVGVLFVNV